MDRFSGDFSFDTYKSQRLKMEGYDRVVCDGLYSDLLAWCQRANATKPRQCKSTNGRATCCSCITDLLFRHSRAIDASDAKTKKRFIEKEEMNDEGFVKEVLLTLVIILKKALVYPEAPMTMLQFMQAMTMECAGNQYYRYGLNDFPHVSAFCRQGLTHIADLLLKRNKPYIGESNMTAFGAKGGFEKIWLFPLKTVSGKTGVKRELVLHKYFKQNVKKMIQNRIFICYYLSWKECPNNFFDTNTKKLNVPKWIDVATRYSPLCKRPATNVENLRPNQVSVNSFIEKSNVLLADCSFTPVGGILIKLSGKECWYDSVHNKVRRHHSNVLVTQLSIDSVSEFDKIYGERYDLNGNLLENAADNGAKPMVSPSPKTTCMFSSRTKWQHDSSSFLLTGDNRSLVIRDDASLEARQLQGLEGIRRQLLSCIQKMVRDAESVGEVPPGYANRFSIRDCFQFSTTKADSLFYRMGKPVVPFPEDVQNAAMAKDVLLYIAIFPLKGEGIWLRTFPSWFYESQRSEGTYVYVPFGSMIVMPATLYQSTVMRTSIDGSPRGVIAVAVCPKQQSRSTDDTEVEMPEMSTRLFVDAEDVKKRISCLNGVPKEGIKSIGAGFTTSMDLFCDAVLC